MNNDCSACADPTVAAESVFVCTLCKGTFHLHCGGVAESTYRRLTKERRAQIKCKQCIATTHEKASGSTPLESELLTKLLEQNTQILATLAIMTKQYDDILLRVRDLEDKNNALEKKNSYLEARVETMETQLEQMDRLNKSKNVEIRGIPEISGENIKNIIFNIKKTTKSNDDNNIDAAYRITQKVTKNQHRPVIIKFKTHMDRDDFLNDVKKFNKQATNREETLNTTLIGMSGPYSRIYISEHLTFQAKHLWFLARKATRENSFKFAWTRGGQVYVRKDVGTPVIIINDKNKHILSLSPTHL